ncbi:LppM family (lipo)protein [Actinomyces procaprae]|uniref:LppM family (lipo)protein n=1 Tax=Actinomyces procaprae TaxID=2560010 RepID=UPI00109DF75E|nr:hypothetical protein [Actinomyces procaprae]
MAVVTSCLRRRSAPAQLRRGLSAAVALGTAALALAGCTARMDMRLDVAGTYDADLVMRDTTGTVFTEATDCEELATESLVGTGEGATVTASPIGSADDADGLGCEVHVTGVPIAQADGDSSGSGRLVVRDGDLYVVHVAGYGSASADGAEGAGGTEGAGSAEGAGGAGDGSEGTGPSANSTAADATESLSTVVDAHLSITFPGAVVDAGGGRVSGTTVTWEDADVLYDGVTASGYATTGAGVSAWDRYGWWIIAGVVAAGVAVGAAALRRHRPRRR